MARYSWCRGPLRKLVRTGTYTAFYQLSPLRIKIPTHMRKQLQINLFSLFNLARNLKDQFSFSCSRWCAWVQLPVVNAHSLDFNHMCFCWCSIGMTLVIIISHLFHRHQFLNQFLSSRHKRSLGGHISVCRHVTLKHNSFWQYMPVMISKRYPKFEELKRMLITGNR